MREVIERTWGWDDAWQCADFDRKLAVCTVSIIDIDGSSVGSLWLEVTPEATHIADAAARGVPVNLAVVPANPRAQALYERLGFEVIEVSAPFIRMRHTPARHNPD